MAPRRYRSARPYDCRVASTEAPPPGGTPRIALVANAASRKCDPDVCAERLRSFGAEVELFAIDQVDRAAAAGADRLVVAGGDGSIAPAAAAAGAAGTPVALIPAGTANDFARRMRLPLDIGGACRLAVRGTGLQEMELGWMGARPFVNVASAGLPGPAARTAKAWKRPLGTLGYAAGALVAGATAAAIPVEVDCDGGTLFEGEAWQVTFAASGAFGAGARIAEADPHDGQLEAVVVAAGPRPGLVALAYRLRSGSLSRHGRAQRARCREAELRVPPGTEFNVDGEVLRSGSVALRGQPGGFRLVVP
jgi:diacylglycerol kinase (ATP)